jgi:putative flavoprotein involved in K+ transport
VILDANERVGDSWRKRWPSLRLYSPARYDALPGMRFPAPRHSFPTGYDMGDYLEAYAKRFDLPVRSAARVEEVSQNGDGYLVTAGDRRFGARNVVIATGVFEKPVTPAFAGELDPRIRQLHSNDYRSPDQLQDGPVLVVGAAHSGGDIAFEVSRAGYQTMLSGRDTGQVPFNIEGRPARAIWPVMRFLATRVLTVSTPIGRKMRPEVRSHGGPLLRYKSADLLAAGVERVFARVVGVENGLPVLEDGRVVEVKNVVWCTGFRNDFEWIKVPFEMREDGFPEQDRGAVPSAPGLYFVGLPFLHAFSSMLILGAGRDAERVARHIASRAAKASSPAIARMEDIAGAEIAA